MTGVVPGRALTAGSRLLCRMGIIMGKERSMLGRSGTKAIQRRDRRAGRLQHPDHHLVRSHAVRMVFCLRAHDPGFASGERTSSDTKPWGIGRTAIVS
jgi:hypothetical protein